MIINPKYFSKMNILNLEFSTFVITYIANMIKNDAESFEQLKSLIDQQEYLNLMLNALVDEYVVTAIVAYNKGEDLTLENGFKSKNDLINELKDDLELIQEDMNEAPMAIISQNNYSSSLGSREEQRNFAISLGKKFGPTTI